MNGLPVMSLATGTDLAAIESSPITSTTTNFTFETGLAITGLEPGGGLATPYQFQQPFQASVSLPPITSVFPPLSGSTTGPSPFGPSGTGPSTTLNPLGNDTETANAAASEVARATPGFDDRISSDVTPPVIVPLPHLWTPEREAAAARKAQPQPPAKAPARPIESPAQHETPRKAEPKAAQPEPPIPTRPVEPAKPDVPKAPPAQPSEPTALNAWDAAIDQIVAEDSNGSPSSLTHRAEESMAFGIVLAAWGGWKAARSRGRSRRRPMSLSLRTLEAGPGKGSRI